MTLADLCEAVLLDRGPLPAGALATELRKRRADVFATLHADARFQRTGKRRASRWSVAQAPSLNAEEAAVRWNCDVQTAAEIIFGEDGLLEFGIVASVDGNGRVQPTSRAAAILSGIEESWWPRYRSP